MAAGSALFSSEPATFNMLIGPFAFSFTVGGSSSRLISGQTDQTQPGRMSFNAAMGFDNWSNPWQSSFSLITWLREFFQRHTVQMDNVTYISKTLALSMVVAFFFGRILRRLTTLALFRQHAPVLNQTGSDDETIDRIEQFEWPAQDATPPNQTDGIMRAAETRVESEPSTETRQQAEGEREQATAGTQPEGDATRQQSMEE
ncbi:hypothetical protein KEM55_005400 [Ascosphaera atra]|nr:hypothetical protein KEM55_005400 [Ascosphaera atra]